MVLIYAWRSELSVGSRRIRSRSPRMLCCMLRMSVEDMAGDSVFLTLFFIGLPPSRIGRVFRMLRLFSRRAEMGLVGGLNDSKKWGWKQERRGAARATQWEVRGGR